MISIVPFQVSQILLNEFCNKTSRGELHSVFKTCLNGLVAGNYLFNIIPEKMWINPRSIKVAQRDWFQHRLSEMRPGDTFLVRDRILFIPSRNIMLFMGKARVWSPGCTFLENPSSEGQIFKKIEVVKRIVGKTDKPSFHFFFERAVEEQIFHLSQSISERFYPKLQETVNSLIGFGPGLTPSCDDFLTGFMATIHFLWRQELELREYGKKICETIASAARGKTSLIAEGMLSEAARGYFSSPILSLMRNLLETKTEGSLEENVHALLSVGASSGTYTLRGIVWGVELLLELKGKGRRPNGSNHFS